VTIITCLSHDSVMRHRSNVGGALEKSQLQLQLQSGKRVVSYDFRMLCNQYIGTGANLQCPKAGTEFPVGDCCQVEWVRSAEC